MESIMQILAAICKLKFLCVLCVIVVLCMISRYIRLSNNKVQLCFWSACSCDSNTLCNGYIYVWHGSPSNDNLGDLPYCYTYKLCMVCIVCKGSLICLLIQWWTSRMQKYSYSQPITLWDAVSDDFHRLFLFMVSEMWMSTHPMKYKCP